MKRWFSVSLSLILICGIMLLPSGCVFNQLKNSATDNRVNSGKEEEDLSELSLELLQAVTDEFINKKGHNESHRLLTIDISAFEELPVEGYEDWVRETYANEDLVIVVFEKEGDAFASEKSAQEYLEENEYEDSESFQGEWDWTEVIITRVSDDEPIDEVEWLKLAFSYRSIGEGEGMRVRMDYEDGAWEADKVEADWNS